MGKTVMGAVVSLDGFIADDNDAVGPLFDWLANGDVTWSFPGSDDEFRTTQASADFMRSYYRDVAAVVIGRRLCDMTNGWDGKPAAGEHVFVVTHHPPTDWEHPGRPGHPPRLRRGPATALTACVGPQVPKEREDDDEPLEALDRARAEVPHERVSERRPRQQEEPEHGDEPAVERPVEHVAEEEDGEQRQP